MNLDLAENTNKLILLVVAAVALLLALNTYQHQLGKNLAVVLSIVTIVVVGYVGFSLMNEKPPMNSNNVVPVNNMAANNMAANNMVANNMAANNVANNMAANNSANNVVEGFQSAEDRQGLRARARERAREMRRRAAQKRAGESRATTAALEEEDDENNGMETFQNQNQNNNAEGNSRLNVETSNSPADSGILNCANLLPADTNSIWAQVSPSGVGELCTKNLLNAGHHVGVNTQGNSLRNANRDLRSQPPNPQVPVSPWLNTTIGPDLLRRPLE